MAEDKKATGQPEQAAENQPETQKNTHTGGDKNKHDHTGVSGTPKENLLLSPDLPEGLDFDYPPIERPRKKHNVKKIVLISVALLVVGLILFNVILNTVRGPAPVYVETQTVQAGDVLQTLSTSGIVTSGERVTIFGAVTAPITAVNVETGSYVAAGTPMFTYDTTDLERNWRQASAARGISGLQAQSAVDASDDSQQAVNDTQASIDNLKIQLSIAQERLAQAVAEYNAQYAIVGPQMEADKLELENLKLIPNPDAATVARMQALQTSIAAAEATLAPYATAVTLAQNDVDYQAALLGQMQSANQQAQAGVLDENAMKQLQYQGVASQVAFEIADENLKKGQAGVQAPISGVLTTLNVEKGSLSSQYAPMCVLESISTVNVVISLSRYDLERVQEGQSAVVTTMGKEYAAQVTKINKMATTTATSNFVAATIAIANPDGDIFLGVEANVDISTGRANNVLVIPITAVNTDVDGTYCYVIQDGVAHRRDITIGLSSDTAVEVTSGLSAGEEVILSSQNITDGMVVTTDPAYSTATVDMTGGVFTVG